MTANTETTDLESILKDHPRLLGILFGATVLLSQIGPVAASAGSVNAGP